MVQTCKIGVVTDDTPMEDLMYRTIINHTLSRIADGMEEDETESDETEEDETESDETEEDETESDETEEDETENLDSLKHLPYWWV